MAFPAPPSARPPSFFSAARRVLSSYRGLVGLGLLLLACVIWLALREPKATENPQTTIRNAAVQQVNGSITPELSSKTRSAVRHHPPQRNSAELYEQAFAALEGLTDEEKQSLSNWNLDPTSQDHAALCAKIQPAIAFAHQTTMNCDWGAKIDTRDARLAYLEQYKQLWNALLWSSTHCRAGDATGARDDMLAALRAAPAFTFSINSHLLNTDLQADLLGHLKRNARSMPQATLAKLSWALSDGSYEQAFHRSLEQQARHVESADFATRVESDDPAKTAQLLEVAAMYREYSQAFGMSEPEYQAWQAKLQSVRDKNPLMADDFLLDNPNNEYYLNYVKRTEYAIVQRAMGAAGLQVLISGPSALAHYLDPATGQPFQYQPHATGFVLTSSSGETISLDFRK
jgi:hypothetical protein